MTSFIEWTAFDDDALNGKLESEARKLECRVLGHVAQGSVMHCAASLCGHWRWLHRGGTRYEKRSFSSEYPMPQGRKAPADVPDGWTFDEWDHNVQDDARLPRYWARRAVEIILPRGLCGIGGQP